MPAHRRADKLADLVVAYVDLHPAQDVRLRLCPVDREPVRVLALGGGERISTYAGPGGYYGILALWRE